MIVTINKFMLIVLAGMVGVIAGCGGGNTVDTPVTTRVAGTASKGIIFPGVVKIFAVDAAGNTATIPLHSGATDSKGQFDIDIGAYSGSVIIEVTGTYTDEATAPAQVVIDSTRPMRAAIDAASTSIPKRIAVTPLTDLAYSLALAGGPLTRQNIVAANAHVAEIFKISDITAIEPVQPNAAVLGTASIEQQGYTLALATISQMANNSNPGVPAAFSQIATLLISFLQDMSASAAAGLDPMRTAAFASALGTITSPTGTLPGFGNASATLSNVGSGTLRLTLTSGTPQGSLIGGVSGTIIFPAGTYIRNNPANGSVLSSLFNATGAGASSSSLATAFFSSSSLNFGVLIPSGFAGGDFATILVDVISGTPTSKSFTLGIGNLKVIDVNGTTLNVPISLK